MATSLPLARGFFDAAAARPSEEQRRQYIEFAESSIRKVFALSDCHRNSWIPVREKKGVAVFRNFGAARGAQAHKSNIAEVGGKGQMQASLDEVARAYAAHDDALFQRLMKKLNVAVLDAAVVATIVPRSPLAPFRYIGIKWFAVKTPTPLVSHRDYCCLEVQDKIVDAYGNEMFVRILNSIDIKECPPLENSHGLVRAKLLAGYMYRVDRAEPTLVRVHHVARYDPGGYFPSQWAYKTAESQLVSSVVQIKRVVEKQQMNACTFVDKKQWVPNHERLHCAVCSRPFGTFRPRHHCRCCGEVICGKCSVFKSVDVPGTTLKNVRICSICNMGVQKARPPRAGHDAGDDASQLDDAMSDISTSSVTSSSTIAHNEMSLMDLYLSGPPGTPSAYSTASAQSNLSMRSTASSRSVRDGRAHRGNSNSGGNGNGNTTPGTARFFMGGGGSARGGHDIFSNSSRVTTTFPSATTPASARGPGTGSLFNETNMPRSYIGGMTTPSRLTTPGRLAGGLGFGGGGTFSAASTPRGKAFSGADATSDAEMTTDDDDDDHARRKSVYKHNPLDLTYLRDSVRVKLTATDSAVTAAPSSNDNAPQTQREEETPAVAGQAAAATTESGSETSAGSSNAAAAVVESSSTGGDATTTSVPAAAAASTTPRRCRGESSAVLLPPAKVPRLELDGDVEMDEDATSDNQQPQQEGKEKDAGGRASTTETPQPPTPTSVVVVKTLDVGMDDEPIRSNATSTSTAESSTAAAVQPLAKAPAETPRKSFLGGLFSRASFESKPAAA